MGRATSRADPPGVALFLLCTLQLLYALRAVVLPGYAWDPANDLNEQHQAIMALLKSGTLRGNRYPTELKPTIEGWHKCHATDCSSRVQVPAPFCTVDCVGSLLCGRNHTLSTGIDYTACCQLDPFDHTYITAAAESLSDSSAGPYCDEADSSQTDWGPRTISYCDYHPLGVDVPAYSSNASSFVTCQQQYVPRYYANHTFLSTWMDNSPVVWSPGVTIGNSVVKFSLKFYDDVYSRLADATMLPSAEGVCYGPQPNNSCNPSSYNKAWRFSMVPELLCLPLEELSTEDVVWTSDFNIVYDMPLFDSATAQQLVPVCLFDGPDRNVERTCWSYEAYSYQAVLPHEMYDVYFATHFIKTWAGAPSNITTGSSFNPDIAIRENFRRSCSFHPLMEHHASRWAPLSPLGMPALGSFPGRAFLPDTLKRLSITRSSKPYLQPMDLPPAIQGPLPLEWSQLSRLEILNLSDATGRGALTGGIPMSWITYSPNLFYNTLRSTAERTGVATDVNSWSLQYQFKSQVRYTRLKLIDVRGHPNFCIDYHRYILFQLLQLTVRRSLENPAWYQNGEVFSSAYFTEQNVKNVWQWIDDDGRTGPVEVLADGKCCFGDGQYGALDNDVRINTFFSWGEPFVNKHGRGFVVNPFEGMTSFVGADFANVCPLTDWAQLSLAPKTVPPPPPKIGPPIPRSPPSPPPLPPGPIWAVPPTLNKVPPKPPHPPAMPAAPFHPPRPPSPPKPPVQSPPPPKFPPSPPNPSPPVNMPSWPPSPPYSPPPITPPFPPPFPKPPPPMNPPFPQHPPPPPSPTPPPYVPINLTMFPPFYRPPRPPRPSPPLRVPSPSMPSPPSFPSPSQTASVPPLTAPDNWPKPPRPPRLPLPPSPLPPSFLFPAWNNTVPDCTASPPYIATLAPLLTNQRTFSLNVSIPINGLAWCIVCGCYASLEGPGSWMEQAGVPQAPGLPHKPAEPPQFPTSPTGPTSSNITNIPHWTNIIDMMAMMALHAAGAVMESGQPDVWIGFKAAVTNDGDFKLQFRLGLRLYTRSISVDTTAPRASGTIGLAANNVGNQLAAEPTAAQAGSEMLLIHAWISFSEPVIPISKDSFLCQGTQVLSVEQEHSAKPNTSFILTGRTSAGALAAIVLPAHAFHDAAGNTGAYDLALSFQVSAPTTRAEARVAFAASTAVGTALGASFAAGAGASFLQALSAKSGLMQASYHVQMLAMSANLASPGVTDIYRQVARYFRWSVLGVKGSLPQAFDDSLSAPATPNSFNTTTLRDAPTGTNQAEASSPSPPQLSPAFAVSPSSSLRDNLEHMYTIYIGQDAPWLPWAGQAPQPGTLKRNLQQQQQPQEQGSSSQAKWPASSPQDLLYTAAIAAILMAAVIVLHACANWAYRRWVDPVLHPYMQFPRLEVCLAALLMVALTFYACLALGPRPTDNITSWRDSRALGIAVLCLLPVPFGVLLWWLALVRAYVASPLHNALEADDGVRHEEIATMRASMMFSQPNSPSTPSPSIHFQHATEKPAAAPQVHLPNQATRESIVNVDASRLQLPDDSVTGADATNDEGPLAGPHWHRFNGPTLSAGPDTLTSAAQTATLQTGSRFAFGESPGTDEPTSSWTAQHGNTAQPATTTRQTAASNDNLVLAHNSSGHRPRISYKASGSIPSSPKQASPATSMISTNISLQAARKSSVASVGGTHWAAIHSEMDDWPQPAVASRPRTHTEPGAMPTANSGRQPKPFLGFRIPSGAGAGRQDILPGPQASAAAKACASPTTDFELDRQHRQLSAHTPPSRMSVNHGADTPFLSDRPSAPTPGPYSGAYVQPPPLLHPHGRFQACATSAESAQPEAAGVNRVRTSFSGAPSDHTNITLSAPRSVAWSEPTSVGNAPGPVAEGHHRLALGLSWQLWGRAFNSVPVAEGQESYLGESSSDGKEKPQQQHPHYAQWWPQVATGAHDNTDARAHPLDLDTVELGVAAHDQLPAPSDQPKHTSVSEERYGRRLAHQEALKNMPSWMAWAVPSPALMERFEFLFEDMIGEEPHQHVERERWWRLIATPFNYTQKVACAAVFGVYGLVPASWEQLGLLATFQAIMLAYLLVSRPYLEWQLHGLELAAHSLELVIFIMAMVLMQGPQWRYVSALNWSMAGCFFATIVLLLIFEVHRIILIVRAVWKAFQEWRKARLPDPDAKSATPDELPSTRPLGSTSISSESSLKGPQAALTGAAAAATIITTTRHGRRSVLANHKRL